MFSSILRRLRGALGNAVVWAGSWFLVSFPLTAVLYAFGYFGAQPYWPIAIATATSLTGMGFLAGGAFSLYLGVAGRERSLDDLNPLRAALGSGLTAGIAIPAFALIVNGLGGVATPIGPSLFIAGMISVLTGFTAFGQIAIVQRELSSGAAPDSIDGGADHLLEGSGIGGS